MEVVQKITTPPDYKKFYHQVLRKWEPQSEVWPFIYGCELTNGLAAVTGFNFSYFVRKQLKLRTYAKITGYAPVTGLSVLGCHLIQSLVDRDIIIGSLCPSCTAMKSVCGQIAFGVLYPLVMAHVVGFYLADRILTYPVPSIVQAPKEVLQLCFKLSKQNGRAILGLTALQVAAALFVTHMKEDSFVTVLKNLHRE